MSKNIAYQTSKAFAEESLRWAGRNPEYAVPVGLAIADPRTRNFALRTVGSFAKETARFKWNMVKATGSNLLKGGKPIGFTKASGTGYIGRAGKLARMANPFVLGAFIAVEIASVQVAVAPDVSGPVYQTHQTQQPSVGKGGSKIIFGSW